MDFKRVISILVLVICVALAVHASPARCKVGTDLISIDTVSGKAKVSELRTPDLELKQVYQQELEFGTRAYLTQNIVTGSDYYELYKYDYFSTAVSDYRKIRIRQPFNAVYFSENHLFTLGGTKDGLLLTKMDWDGFVLDSKIIPAPPYPSVKKFIMDEDDGAIIVSLRNYDSPDKVALISLKTNQIVFEDRGRLLFDISDKSRRIYYSKINSVYCVDYGNGIHKKQISSFAKDKIEIVELKPIGDKYVVVTKEKRFDLLLKILFGVDDWINRYYLCSLENDGLSKLKLLHTKKPGEIFN